MRSRVTYVVPSSLLFVALLGRELDEEDSFLSEELSLPSLLFFPLFGRDAGAEKMMSVIVGRGREEYRV